MQVFKSYQPGKAAVLANRAHSLSHTKWMRKHRIVFTPKHGRKAVCGQCRGSLGEMFRQLRGCKGAEMTEGRLMPDHVRILVSIPPKLSASGFMGYLKGKSALMVFGKHANPKCKFGDGRFWSEGCCVSTVGLSEATIAKYIREQEAHGIALGKLSVKEHGDPFKK